MKSWSGAKASYFHCKARINYFRALEDRTIAIPYPFMPKLLLTELTENEQNHKNGPWYHSIIIARIYFRLVSLAMLSMGLRPAVSCQSRPELHRLQIAVSVELKLVNVY